MHRMPESSSDFTEISRKTVDQRTNRGLVSWLVTRRVCQDPSTNRVPTAASNPVDLHWCNELHSFIGAPFGKLREYPITNLCSGARCLQSSLAIVHGVLIAQSGLALPGPFTDFSNGDPWEWFGMIRGGIRMLEKRGIKQVRTAVYERIIRVVLRQHKTRPSGP